MNVSVLGCGRWGSFHGWYANHIGHTVTLWGRESSANLKRLKETRQNDYLTLPPEVTLTSDLARALKTADMGVISVKAQELRSLARQLHRPKAIRK